MAIQQLDLFGNPVEIPTTKEESVKAMPAKKKEAVEEDNTPKSLPLFDENALAATEINEEIKETPTEETGGEVVYSDNQIMVKLKKGRPKKIVANDEVANDSPKIPEKKGRKILAETISPSGILNVPDDETLNKKMYYKIAIVADWFGVNASLIRYWENEFDILKPRLTRKGDRLFRVEDIKNLQLIYQLVKIRKFSIEGAKAYLKQDKQKADVHMELSDSLTKIRTFLVDLKSNLDV